jgi:non-specific serine/threonine protein kinase/serine/threonine-protein kinase
MIPATNDRCAACGTRLAVDGGCPSCLLALGFATHEAPETPPGDLSPVVQPERVGPYRVLETLGQGGMGIVYLVEQERPIRRRAALKLVRPGLDSGTVLTRFESERQALALMRHPNVAQVYDAGVADDGRPYFVMEYVPGEPITAFCDRERSPIRERLELFLQACDALQHAHQKGIIHRDVKPSNLLVFREGARLTVKVIDFGVAKAMHQKLTERTLHTQYGIVLGTPDYMSPEQAGTTAVDVDTRADIYSLGVVLYELLVGALPFDPAELRKVADLEMLRMIREVDPPRPSARLASLGQTAQDVARRRQNELPTLVRVVSGELEWIVLKALEKDPGRRYASASELAADLRRYLGDEPVLARPQTARYRLGKFVRRNKGMVVATAAVLVALTAGLVASTVLYLRAVAARDAARAETEKARAINTFLQETIGSADPGKQGRQVLVFEALGRAAAKVDESFPDQPDVRVELHRTIGGVYNSLGMMHEAEAEISKVLEYDRRTLGDDARETIETLKWLGLVHMDSRQYAKALEDFGTALERSKRAFGLEDPTTAESMHLYGNVYSLVGRFTEAEPLLVEALRLHDRVYGPEHHLTGTNHMSLATMYGYLEQLDKAEQHHRRAIDIYRESGGEMSWVMMRAQQELGNIYVREGQLDRAEPILRHALEVCEREFGPLHNETSMTESVVAQLEAARGNLPKAERILREAVTRLRKGDLGERLLPSMVRGWTYMLGREGKDEGIPVGRDAVALAVRTFGEKSHLHAAALRAYGFALYRAAHPDPVLAETKFREAIALYHELYGDGPHPWLANGLAELGRMLHAVGRHREASELFAQALGMFEQLGDAPWVVAQLQTDLGGCLFDDGRYAEAEQPLAAGYEALRSRRGDSDSLTVAARDRRIALLEATGRNVEADALRRVNRS